MAAGRGMGGRKPRENLFIFFFKLILARVQRRWISRRARRVVFFFFSFHFPDSAADRAERDSRAASRFAIRLADLARVYKQQVDDANTDCQRKEDRRRPGTPSPARK